MCALVEVLIQLMNPFDIDSLRTFVPSVQHPRTIHTEPISIPPEVKALAQSPDPEDAQIPPSPQQQIRDWAAKQIHSKYMSRQLAPFGQPEEAQEAMHAAHTEAIKGHYIASALIFFEMLIRMPAHDGQALLHHMKSTMPESVQLEFNKIQDTILEIEQQLQEQKQW